MEGSNDGVNRISSDAPIRRSGWLLSPNSSAHSSFSEGNGGGINWAQVDSSDEESQKSYSSDTLSLMGELTNMSAEAPTAADTAAESRIWTTSPHHHRQQQPEPYRRPPRCPNQRVVSNSNSSSNRSINESEQPNADPDNSESRSRSTTRDVVSFLPSIVRCTPVKMLIGLFVATCYTTFWLPYPEIRPHQVSTVPRFQQAHASSVSVGVRNATSTVLLVHAQASPDVELEFRPGLDRYFEQEEFSYHAWTKYANLGALGTVIAWAVREQHRRREETTATSSATLWGGGGHQVAAAGHSAAAAFGAYEG